MINNQKQRSKSRAYQFVGIGNAIVDVLNHIDYDFLEHHGIHPGIMQLIDLDRARFLYERSNNATEVSGGSAANTVAGLAMMGVKTAYIGKVKDDSLGKTFATDIRKLGTVFQTELSDSAQPYETGRSLIMVTPEGERSMNTYLGASEFLTSDDIDLGIVGNTEWLYLEGYRFDGPGSQQAFYDAIELCQKEGGKVAIALSDPFCVKRHLQAFQDLVEHKVDAVFANEAEILSLFEDLSLDQIIGKLDKNGKFLFVTLSEKGAMGIRNGERHYVKAYPTTVVDATGAGDQFAAGCFYGLLNNHPLETAIKFGCIAASEVIGHLGPRPKSNVLAMINAAI